MRNDFKKFAKGHLNVSSSVLDGYQKRASNLLIPRNMTPYIVEERELNVAQMDVFSRLMMDRVIFLGMPICDQVANVVQAQLLFLQSTNSDKDINIYINSPGGEVYAGLGIYDTMQYVKPNVNTICTGMAASMGAVLLAAGKQRSALKHSRVMIHQPSGGTYGVARDMEIDLKEMQSARKDLYEILAKHTNRSETDIATDCDRDYWMRAEEAKLYGIIDKVL